ncbi:MAG: DUF4124 domain-containing protein [Betaproteobacteria bacterium]|nr:DUF4124 domain-containing protein [Betaproteobacteria bacterium]
MPMPRITVSALLAAGALALAGTSAAALYKWTDASGRVVYSDQPPTGNVKVETIQGAPPPSNPNALKDLAAKEGEFKKRQLDAAEAAKKAEAQRAELAKVGDACARAQMQIKQLAAEMIGLARYNEKGEIVYVDDATRRRERQQLETWYKANCGS